MTLSTKKNFQISLMNKEDKAYEIITHKGTNYVIAEKGKEFIIRVEVKNPSRDRYAMKLAVDGSDIPGVRTVKTYTYFYGFRRGLNSYAAFRFDNPPNNLKEEVDYNHGTITIDFYSTWQEPIARRKRKAFMKQNIFRPVVVSGKKTTPLSIVEGDEYEVEPPAFFRDYSDNKLVCNFNDIVDSVTIRYLEFPDCLLKRIFNLSKIEHCRYVPLSLLLDKETGYLNRVLQTILLSRENYRIGTNLLREEFRKVMGMPLHTCFEYPDNFDGFVKNQKATFILDGDMLTLTAEVIKNNEKAKGDDNVINLISDDEEGGDVNIGQNHINNGDGSKANNTNNANNANNVNSGKKEEAVKIQQERYLKILQENNWVSSKDDEDDIEIDYGDNY